MEDTTRVLDLLCRWEEGRAAGGETSVAVLCQDCPELIPVVESHVRLLVAFGKVASAAAAVVPGPQQRPNHPRYAFTDYLAEGGMGEVWAGFDTALKRPVALKILFGGVVAAADLTRRLREEAHLGSKLARPGIVPVYDIGELADGRPFLVMKLIQGKTLGQLLKERPGPLHDLDRWVLVFENICRIVGFAHAEKVLHRDLKPSNVMVDDQGEVHVLDWGIAKLFEEEGHDSSLDDPRQPRPPRAGNSEVTTLTLFDRTAAGQAKGTSAYMAPEQAQGEVRRIGTRSDVFGLGGILCVILTGRPTYEAPAGELVLEKAKRADLTETFARLDACGADRELIAIARWCLAPEPDDRPRNAAEVTVVVENYRLLGRLRASLPPAGLLTRTVQDYPFSAGVFLALLPHALGVTLVAAALLLWSAFSWPEAFPAVTRILLAYSAGSFLLVGTLAWLLKLSWLRVLVRFKAGEPVTQAQITTARQRSLRLRHSSYVLSALGWLPGGILVPWLLGISLGSVVVSIHVYLVPSLLLIGSIATMYSSLVADFLTLRVAYPWLWLLPRDLTATVLREIPRDPGRYRLLPLFATLVPLGVALMFLTAAMFSDPGQADSPGGRLVQGLAILLVGLGMVGSVLAGMMANYLRRVVTGYFAALGIVLGVPSR